MQAAEETWWQAIEAEEAVSAAVVEAERVLQQLLQHHLSSSPTVDNAVSELDLRRSEYERMQLVTDEADAIFNLAQWEVIVAEPDHRRAEHEQRAQAVLQQSRARQLHASAIMVTPSHTNEQDEVRCGDAEDSSSSANARDPPTDSLMAVAIVASRAVGVPPSPPAPPLTQAQMTGNLSGRESETKSQDADSDVNDGSSVSVESSEFVPSTETEDSESSS
ncbi:hypothetical protein PR002_g27841 [Phytophthora rubi]|uniref:Uncharacterized protein n=1 Tax=Phytophthora rubi TaxID=129364 RepID=A0A6A3HG49_9STRA|nr:hypothetical protein PR002_g27841 [Phytophthora rubi]